MLLLAFKLNDRTDGLKLTHSAPAESEKGPRRTPDLPHPSASARVTIFWRKSLRKWQKFTH
jgi:hypothetical protein